MMTDEAQLGMCSSSWEENTLEQLQLRDDDHQATAASADERNDDDWHAAIGTAKAEARERPAGTPKLLVRRVSEECAPSPAHLVGTALVAGHQPPTPTAPKSATERERDYAAARARIFGDASADDAGSMFSRNGSWAEQALAAASSSSSSSRPHTEANVVIARGPSADGVGFESRQRTAESPNKVLWRNRNAEMHDPDFCRDGFQQYPPRPRASPLVAPYPAPRGYYGQQYAYEQQYYPYEYSPRAMPRYPPPATSYGFYPTTPPSAQQPQMPPQPQPPPLPPGPPPPLPRLGDQYRPLTQQAPNGHRPRTSLPASVQHRPPRAIAQRHVQDASLQEPAANSAGRSSESARRHKASSTTKAAGRTNHNKQRRQYLNETAAPQRQPAAVAQRPPNREAAGRSYDEEFPSLGA